MKTYQQLAQLVSAWQSCKKSDNKFFESNEKWISEIMADAPRGGGFDSGTKLELKRSSEDRLIFSTSFHHMNEVGYYDGWSEHEVIVTPSLAFGFYLRVTGRNRNEIKEYIGDVFSEFLETEIK